MNPWNVSPRYTGFRFLIPHPKNVFLTSNSRLNCCETLINLIINEHNSLLIRKTTRVTSGNNAFTIPGHAKFPLGCIVYGRYISVT